MKINILYIIEELELGGAERVVIDQARLLDKSRFEVKVCCLRRKGDFAPLLEKENLAVIELHKKKGVDLTILLKIIHVIQKHHIDIVHTHLWVANFWGRAAAILTGVPVVVTEHNVDVWKKWHHKRIDRLLAPLTQRICTVSEGVKRFYINEVGLPAQKLTVVYNGIEPEPSTSTTSAIETLKGEFGIKNGAPVLVNIGRLVEAKANHIFIEALEILHQRSDDFFALIIGEGRLKERLMLRGKKLIDADKLIFTGLRKDVPQILDMAAVSVLSSTREGLSMVILESMAKGVPFVATDVGGNRELILDQQTGFLVEENNALALADAIERILKNPTLAERMGKAAQRRVREYFTVTAMIEKMEGIYKDVLEK